MFRHVALALTASLLIVGCGAPSIGSLPMGTAGDLSAKRSVKKANPATSELAKLVVNSVTSLRDGGTKTLKGYVNRSTYVTVKLDGAISSRTRGQFFIAIYEFGQAEGELRPLTADEAAPLAKGIRSNMTRAGADLNVSALEAMAKALESNQVADGGTFADLELLSIEALPVRCPCFELKAKGKNGRVISVKFSGFGAPYAIDEVNTGDVLVSDTTETRNELGKALADAAGKLKDKEQAAKVKAVAKALAP